MRPGEAQSHRRAHMIDGTDRIERQVRTLAEGAIKSHPNGGDVNLPHPRRAFFTASDALPAQDLPIIRVFIPGNDFAAQLVVEKQIREQIA